MELLKRDAKRVLAFVFLVFGLGAAFPGLEATYFLLTYPEEIHRMVMIDAVGQSVVSFLLSAAFLFGAKIVWPSEAQ